VAEANWSTHGGGSRERSEFPKHEGRDLELGIGKSRSGSVNPNLVEEEIEKKRGREDRMNYQREVKRWERKLKR